jgi:hypothetical protein
MTVTCTVAVMRPVPRVGSLFGRSLRHPAADKHGHLVTSEVAAIGVDLRRRTRRLRVRCSAILAVLNNAASCYDVPGCTATPETRCRFVPPATGSYWDIRANMEQTSVRPMSGAGRTAASPASCTGGPEIAEGADTGRNYPCWAEIQGRYTAHQGRRWGGLAREARSCTWRLTSGRPERTRAVPVPSNPPQAVSRPLCGVPPGNPSAQDGILVAVAGGGVDREAQDPLLQPFTPWW